MMASQPEGVAVHHGLEQEGRITAQAAPKSMKHREEPQPGSREHTELERTFFLTECAVLHDEINTRMEQRGNLFTFTIITAGSLLSLGAAANAQIALFYPILSLFLAAAWSDEDGKIGSLGAYLRDQEARYGLSGWSSYHRPRKRRSGLLGKLQQFYPTSLLSLATRGVFLSTQALAILVGVTNALAHSQLASIWPLLSVALLAMILTAIVIRHKRRHALEREMRE
jgi:hypothetical protein